MLRLSLYSAVNKLHLLCVPDDKMDNDKLQQLLQELEDDSQIQVTLTTGGKATDFSARLSQGVRKEI